jgi:Spy/CpxP family protein refolding chaperone
MYTMKTMIKCFIFCLLVLCIYELPAQNRGWGIQIHQRILKAKLTEIQKSLQLDSTTFERFKPIYTAYEKELTTVNQQERDRVMRVNSDNLTSDEADKMVLSQFRNARKLIDLREKFYPEFKTVLTPPQIIKLYQTEGAIRLKVMQELRRRFGNRFN